jgi:hypothetical protein
MNNFSKTSFLSGALLAILWPLTSFAADTDQVQPIIAASKAATGGANWDQVKTWRETGKITLGGLEGTYEAWFDFPDVRTALTFKLGPAKGAQGWNGQESWSTDASNQLRVETSQEAIANAVKSAYQGVHSFYFPGRYPAELKYGGAKDNDGHPCDVIVCKPKDSDPFEVWFDQTTHYLVKMVDLTGEQTPDDLLLGFSPV